MSSSTSKKRTPAPKKSTFSAEEKYVLTDRGYVDLAPKEDDIATTSEAARYLPIDVVERDLDRWAWGTQNFTWKEFRDKNGNLWIGASLELLIPWSDGDGKIVERKIVGACNFQVVSYAPNSHFVATAKSECVKNAASDLGKKFGRGLNDAMVVAPPAEIPIGEPKAKLKPDNNMLERIRKAKEEGDTAALSIFGKVYEINTQENE